MKKKRLRSQLVKSGKQTPRIPCMPGQCPSKDLNSKDRPKHTYSTRAQDRLKSPKCPDATADAAGRRVCANSPGRNHAEEPVTFNCAAALPALVITPCQTRSPSLNPRSSYHYSCTPSPSLHTPRTGHIPQRDFDSYALRYLAQKAIKHSKQYAEDRSLERAQEHCRRHSCSPSHLTTRHKHYCSQKRFREDGTVSRMVSNALGKGFDALRSLVEDGPLGNSARYCRRRIKRLLRPIWCNCLRHTCLGPPADPLQRYVLTGGKKVRDRSRNRELVNKFARLPTPLPGSGSELSGLNEPQLVTGTNAMAKETSSTSQIPALAMSEPQLQPSPKSPFSTNPLFRT